MDERPLYVRNRVELVFPAVISLAVGLMFFIPGVFFAGKALAHFWDKKQIPDFPMAFIIVFTLTIGTILLLLAYKFLFGNFEKQHISTPILTFVSIWFVAMSTIFALTAYVFKAMPTGFPTGRGIGGGFAIGCSGLWFAYKRKSAR
jgi:hypothetical protein